MTVALDDRTRVEVLWPPAERRDGLSVNETSLVLRIVCDDQSVLLPGDIEAVGQSELARRGEVLACDALVLPHHGIWSEALPAFVAATAPRVVMASSARRPRAPLQATSHAGEFYSRLHSAYRYYTTPRNGWIHLAFGRGRLEVQATR